jgi:hypothetical protein
MAFAIPRPVKPIFDFTVQVLLGAIGFLVIFGAAVAISVFVKACDGMVPHWVQAGAEFAEKALFAVDLFCFCLFILSEALKLLKGLWNEWRT